MHHLARLKMMLDEVAEQRRTQGSSRTAAFLEILLLKLLIS